MLTFIKQTTEQYFKQQKQIYNHKLTTTKQCYWNPPKENVKLLSWDSIWVAPLLFSKTDKKFSHLLSDVELPPNWKEFPKLNPLIAADFSKGSSKLKMPGPAEPFVFVLKPNPVSLRLNSPNPSEPTKWIYKQYNYYSYTSVLD